MKYMRVMLQKNKSVLVSLLLAAGMVLSACGQQVDVSAEYAKEAASEINIEQSVKAPEEKTETTPLPVQTTSTPLPTAEPVQTVEPVQTPVPVVVPEIETTVNKAGWVTGSNVNVRQYPDTKYDIITVCDKNQEIVIFGSNGSWTKVNVNGQTGYIKSDYITDIAPTPVTEEIKLDDSTATVTEDHILTFTGEYTPSISYNSAYIQSRIIELTNAQRTMYGLSGLSYDVNLQYTADTRASEQAELFSHTRPNGTDWSTAFPGGYSYMGENLATCDSLISDEEFASSCVSWWMQSEGHRSNILNSSFTKIAVGVFVSGNNMYAVQSFGA